MRRSKQPLSCTVVVALNKSSVLEITTTASHALEIIRGKTIIPSQHAHVTDLDGRPLYEQDLVRLKKSER